MRAHERERRIEECSADRPAVLQVADAAGKVVWTGYDVPLPAASALPAPAIAVTTAPATIETPEPKPKRGPRIPLAIGAGWAALASGGLYLESASAERRFYEPETPYDEVGGLQQTANATRLDSIGAGAAAVGRSRT